MNVLEEPMRGVRRLSLPSFRDARGEFIKSFHVTDLMEIGMEMNVRESFYSVSAKNVLRGMHFQIPPFDSTKLVTCVTGRLLDVLVDLRKDEATFGSSWQTVLSADNREAVWIPTGIAHGFLSLADNTCMAYLTDQEHAPQHDAGIRWDSFGFDWPCRVEELNMSDRDKAHPTLGEFHSPFGSS